ARGPWSRRRRRPAGAARRAGGPFGARRRASGLARRPRAARTVARGRPRAARDAARMVEDRVDPRRRAGRSIGVSAPEIRVSRDWLALREPADAAARAGDLAERLARRP